MPLQAIRHAHDAAFRDQRVRRDGLLDGAGAEAVRGHVDDVVAAAHDVHVPLRIDHARVARVEPPAGKAFQVARIIARWVVEEGREACGCEGEREHDVAHCAGGDFGAVVGDDAHVEAREGFACGAGADGEGRRWGLEEEEEEDGRPAEGRRAMPVMGEPDSEDHQLSMTIALGAAYFPSRSWYMRTILGSLRSPAKNSARRFRNSPFSPREQKKSLSGSSRRTARSAVGAVKSEFTRYSEQMRQKVPASGVPMGLPSKSTVVAPARRGA